MASSAVWKAGFAKKRGHDPRATSLDGIASKGAIFSANLGTTTLGRTEGNDATPTARLLALRERQRGGPNGGDEIRCVEGLDSSHGGR